MFCNKCGKPFEGEGTLCSDCAAEQTTVLHEEATTQETNIIEETPVFDTFELNTDAAPAKKARKKKGGLIAGIVALAVVAAAVVGFIFFGDQAKGFVDRTFQSPDTYLVNVESAAIADYTADLTKAYGTMLGSYNANQTAANAELRLTLGDELLALAESTLQQQGMTLDIDWLREITLSVNANIQDNAMQTGLGIGLGTNKLISADVIYDMANGKGYLTIPELNKDYLCVDIASAGGNPDQMKDILSKSTELRNALAKALPTEAEMNELINTYVDIVLSGIKNVEKATDTVTIDGVSQKMVVLTAKITEKDLVDIAEKALEKAEDDKNLKKIIEGFGDYMDEIGEISGTSFDTEDLYPEFTEAIRSALEDLEETKEEASKDNYLKLKVYVDMKNNVRGHELAVYSDGEKEGDTISWMTVAKGDTTYTEAKLGEVLITGEKTEKKGVAEGFYTLTVDDEEIGTLEFENATETSATMRLIPSEDILSDMLSGSGIPTSLLGDNLALELSYDTKDSKVTYDVNILVGAKTLIGLGMTSEAASGGKITIPSNALDVTSGASLEQWVKNAKFDAILDAMETANVPKDLVDTARNYINQFQQQMG